MTSRQKVFVAGATGLVGASAVQALSDRGKSVFAGSRRPNSGAAGVTPVQIDVRDGHATRSVIESLPPITHLAYAALFELPELMAGWSDNEQIDVNDAMFRNLLDAIESKGALEHVTLLQGTKAYGVHVRDIATPAREDRDECHEQPNFYWKQEGYLRERGAAAGWAWTILRPTLIVGGGISGAMNLLPAIGVYASLKHALGEPCGFPGGGARIGNAVDADLLANVIDWATDTESAKNQIFNVTNGDVFVWEQVWPALMEALGVEAGPPNSESIEAFCRKYAALWDEIRRKNDLTSPELDAFVGPSLQYCDYQLRYGKPETGAPAIVSTVKLHAAGFHEVMDTEVMFAKWP